MINNTIRTYLGAALALAVAAFSASGAAEAAPFKSRHYLQHKPRHHAQPVLDPRGGEMQMINLQQTITARQTAATLSSRIISSSSCKQCVANIGR